MLVFRGVTLLFENQPQTCGVLFSHKTQIRSLRPVPWDSPRPLASAVNEAASVPTWHRFPHQRNGWFHQHGEISPEILEMAEIGNPSFFEGSMWMNSRCMLTVNRKRWWAIMLFPYARNLQFSSLHNVIKHLGEQTYKVPISAVFIVTSINQEILLVMFGWKRIFQPENLHIRWELMVGRWNLSF